MGSEMCIRDSILGCASYDNGLTWGPEFRVTRQHTATMSTSLINGNHLVVVWVDHREAFLQTELYSAESFDYGATWTEEVRLTDSPHFVYHPVIEPRYPQAMLFWEDSRDGENFQYEIYMRYYDATTSIEEGLMPANRFSQVDMVTYPNPFNESVAIEVTASNLNSVDVGIYNVLGELIRDFINTDMTSKQNQISWDGTDINNRKVASGIYFVRCGWKGGSKSNKLLLIK